MGVLIQKTGEQEHFKQTKQVTGYNDSTRTDWGNKTDIHMRGDYKSDTAGANKHRTKNTRPGNKTHRNTRPKRHKSL